MRAFRFLHGIRSSFRRQDHHPKDHLSRPLDAVDTPPSGNGPVDTQEWGRLTTEQMRSIWPPGTGGRIARRGGT